MKNLMQEALKGLNADTLRKKRITLGFDGCEDIICKVVEKNEGNTTRYFETITDFSRYLSGKSGISCSIELEQQVSKVGGNCAIFASAVSGCAVDTSVIGLFGKNQINEIFDSLKENCKMYSYHENALSISLEFKDGKIMLSPNIKIKGDIWEEIIRTVGEENMNRLLCGTDMLGLVNWSELEYSTYLWSKIYECIQDDPDKEKQMIIDLSDCSRNSAKDISEVLLLLKAFSKIRTVTLSLNESEAIEINKILGNDADTDYKSICLSLAQKIDVDRLVIHSSKSCYTAEKNGQLSRLPTQFNSTPKLLTGAGDNFNAGYTIGCLLRKSGAICNVYGNAMSSYYIANGKSPNLEQLRNHIIQWHMSLNQMTAKSEGGQ